MLGSHLGALSHNCCNILCSTSRINEIQLTTLPRLPNARVAKAFPFAPKREQHAGAWPLNAAFRFERNLLFNSLFQQPAEHLRQERTRGTLRIMIWVWAASAPARKPQHNWKARRNFSHHRMRTSPRGKIRNMTCHRRRDLQSTKAPRNPQGKRKNIHHTPPLQGNFTPQLLAFATTCMGGAPSTAKCFHYPIFFRSRRHVAERHSAAASLIPGSPLLCMHTVAATPDRNPHVKGAMQSSPLRYQPTGPQNSQAACKW